MTCNCVCTALFDPSSLQKCPHRSGGRSARYGRDPDHHNPNAVSRLPTGCCRTGSSHVFVEIAPVQCPGAAPQAWRVLHCLTAGAKKKGQQPNQGCPPAMRKPSRSCRKRDSHPQREREREREREGVPNPNPRWGRGHPPPRRGVWSGRTPRRTGSAPADLGGMRALPTGLHRRFWALLLVLPAAGHCVIVTSADIRGASFHRGGGVGVLGVEDTCATR